MGYFKDLIADDTPESDVSRFTVEFEAANSTDIALSMDGRLPPDDVRSVELSGYVDTGAHDLILPEIVGDSLGLPEVGKVTVRFADGRAQTCRRVGNLWITIAGRSTVLTAVLLPKRTEPLIGAFVLEALDLLVDAKESVLIPRDPDAIISVVE